MSSYVANSEILLKDKIKKRGDNFFKYVIPIYFILGLLFSIVHQTWIVGIGVGLVCLIICLLSYYLLPKSNLYQYVISAVMAIFMAQFIYQMHGLFEMHFFVFIGSIVLVAYQNWKLQIPLVLIVVIHHASFAYMQYAGNEEIYFTQLAYMDLNTFLIHVALAAVIFVLNGYWSYTFYQDSTNTEETNQRLNKNLNRISNNIHIAKEISSGNLESEFEVDEDDELGNALREMQTNLKASSGREKSEKYITSGLAEIGDILRDEGKDLESLSDAILKKLVKYTNSNQGGLFLLKDGNEESYLELVSCYAYNRKKYIENKFLPGEGLIGQVFLEKEKVYLKKVPDDFVNIGSGLGEARPNNVIIVPLKINENVVGILELATFEEYTNYQQEFLDKVSENIASTISSAKVNENTKKLLQDSQEKAQQLSAQEEEMRQNFEELQATQEEMQRKEYEIRSRMEAVNKSGIASIEFDTEGHITFANDNFLGLFEYELDEIKGKHHRIFVDKDYAESEAYAKFWEDIKSGVNVNGEFERYGKSGKKVYISGTYSPVKGMNGNITGFLKLAIDISKTRNLLSISQKHLEEIEKQEVEFREMIEDMQGAHHKEESLRKELEHKVQQLEAANEDLKKQMAEQAK